jgi:hypothetical protein
MFLVLGLFLVVGCEMPRLPSEPADLPQLPEMPDLIRDLGLPDLSQIPNLPEVNDLPVLNVGPNAVAFAGPTERRIAVGERIPGTDIELVGISEQGADFRLAGLNSSRSLGDSLDYEGAWPGLSGVTYSLRLRIYTIGSDSVRAAGVHRLVVEEIQPVQQAVQISGTTISIPFAGSVNQGERIKGLTFGYAGSNERGAEISGLPADVYPYRKLGDSLNWSGLLRPDIPVEYSLRVLFYNENALQVGGVATIGLPAQ